jgi:hypothetical protein
LAQPLSGVMGNVMGYFMTKNDRESILGVTDREDTAGDFISGMVLVGIRDGDIPKYKYLSTGTYC